MMGVALAAGPAKHDGAVHEDMVGVLLGIGAACGSAVYSLLWKMLGTKTALFVATAYWAVAAVHLLALPAYPFMRTHGFIEAWRLPPTRSLNALLGMSAVLASSVNMINIFIIAKAGAGVLAVGSAASIPIAFVLDFYFHSEMPMTRELAGCFLIIFSVGLTLAGPNAAGRKFLPPFMEKSDSGTLNATGDTQQLLSPDLEADGSRRR